MYSFTWLVVNRGSRPSRTRTTYSALFMNRGEAAEAAAKAYNLNEQQHTALYLDGYVKAPSKITTRIMLFNHESELNNETAQRLADEGMVELPLGRYRVEPPAVCSVNDGA